MFNSRRASKRDSKQQNRGLKKRKPNLSVDTTFSRHRAPPPHEILDRCAAPRTERTAGQTVALNANDNKTPMIIITPAREDFDLPDSFSHNTGQRRAPSSVYSRATDYLPRSRRFSRTPPLPFLAPRTSSRRNDSHDYAQDTDMRRPQAASIYTEFEEDVASQTSPGTAPVHRSISGLVPTPRRSNGWWNIINSPFSASSHLSLWKSPVPDDRTPILRGNRKMSLDSDEEALRSAPPAYHDRPFITYSEPHRSVTAPIIMSTNDDGVNIYRIPSQGEAAPYYDIGRHFPSLVISPTQARSILETETPVTVHELPKNASDNSTVLPILVGPITDPFADGQAAPEQSKAMFSTPSADELKTPIPMPCMPEHSPTTLNSQFSPLSPSPILGKAHLAQVIGEVKGEQKEVDVFAPRQTPPSSPAHGPQGLAAATMASRSLEDATSKHVEAAAPPHPYMHSRSSSYGLGITGSEVELFPAAKEADEKQAEKSVAGDAPPDGPPWYRRYLWVLLALGTGLVTLAVVLIVMHVPQNHNDIAVQAQWVNLTGFPDLPVGVMTVAQPKAVRKEDGCVQQSALWSCGISADQRTNTTGLPNFRFEVRFRNDSSLNSTLVQSGHQRRSGGSAVAALSSVRRMNILARDSWTDSLFEANPAPPPDQVFLGNTTDNNTLPYDGEATPFYVSLVDAKALTLQKRQSSVYPYPTTDNSTDGAVSQTGPQSIPKPTINSDGTPTSERLYPLAEAQPLRLYKRQQQDEHYGFYTFYDRTVYIANSSSGSIISNTPLSNASAVCTWSQTRFLVQIWTRGLLSSVSIGNGSSDAAASNSTANDMTFPGSFPYAVTVTVDRHGGDASQKGVYCYGIGANQQVEQNVKSWIAEDRAHGGTIINPGSVPTNNGSSLSKQVSDANGGIDGGTGGCACAWQNW
ncbi:hypothetical protein AMS68_002586 [Peltaster fructicola]|uniref:Glycoprotease family protein n=1 Tax=Peltaster fructicola TaxID=286661 RepID=A0A6H0XR18_9PEZI|nr:hypothetical protein AMS68_002586 [Peltaster fructicola]